MTDDCCLLFHALSDPTRQKILEILSKKKEMTVSGLVKHFKISQPSVSHHLDILKRAGVVTFDKRGREVYYRLNRDEIQQCCGSFFNRIQIKVVKLC